MKKQTIAFFILIFTAAGLTAETGYQSHKWYETINNFSRSNRIQFEDDPLYGLVFPLAYNKNIENEQTILYYGFDTEYFEFIAAGFTVTNKTAEKIKSKLGPKINTYKITTEYRTEEELDFEGNEEEIRKYKDCFIFVDLRSVAYGIDLGYVEEFEKGDGVITIYNYNDDTRAYVFENFYDKRTTIVFIPYNRGY